jgi:uncharacterized membrane protein
MSLHTNRIRLLTVIFLWLLSMTSHAAPEADSVILYTPYTKITVPPGESISYTIDLINNSSEVIKADISLAGLPSGWNYILKSGIYNIRQLSVLPGEKKSMNLTVNVPLKVNKGNYRFRILAGTISVLPLNVIVSEQGTFKTEFTTEQANMQGNSTSTFTFQAALKNLTADKQLYAIMANAPRGWNIVFKHNYQQVTSVEIDANNNADITIEVDPPDMIEAGTYKIPVLARTNVTSIDLELEVVITGSYAIELTTPTGLLSTSLTAGDQKRIELIAKNTGSAELTDIQLSASTPINWEVTFDPAKIEKIEARETAQAFAVIKAPRKAIAGDYVTNIEAKTPEASSKASFRISVKTSMLWGWVGVLIIIIALGSVYYLFRKYGRR